jgi:iron-sulfur cluster assembly protein
LALDEVGDGDVVFEQEGVKLIVDPRSLDLLRGAVIDYRKDGLGEGFSIETAQPLPACACGRPCEQSTADETDEAS